MIIVNHRVNAVEDLLLTAKDFGCEIDVRNHGESLIVNHDPFDTDGPTLQDWLSHYDHRFLIVNVKEEGLEPVLFPILRDFGIEHYFVLDESFPYIMKYCRLGHRKFALRVSEIEKEDTAIAVYEKLSPQEQSPNWIWADCFTGKPLSNQCYRNLVERGFKVCFVSPELHHLERPKAWKALIASFIQNLKDSNMKPDMVCTKEPELWRECSSWF